MYGFMINRGDTDFGQEECRMQKFGVRDCKMQALKMRIEWGQNLKSTLKIQDT